MNTLLKVAVTCLAPALVYAAGTSTASAQSVLRLTDTATGETRVFTPDNARFTLSGDEHSLYFSAGAQSSARSALGSAWYIRFEAPEGETLGIGRYAGAGCPGRFRTGRAAGLEATDNNPVCRGFVDTLWGSFAIRQLEYDRDGRITELEATFVQREGSATAPALVGLLRYNAAPRSFTVKADRDFAWGPISQNNHGDSSFFALSGGLDGVTYDASVHKDQWRVQITPRVGQQLRAGRYRTAREASAGKVGLVILRGLEPQHCDGNGLLDIDQVETDPSGQVRKLNASFVYRCGRTAPALRGTIRYTR